MESDVLEGVRKRDVPVVAEHVRELNEEQEQCRHVLEARHDRMGREFDQCAQLHQAEQRLKNATEQNDGEENQQSEWQARRLHDRRVGMQERVQQQPDEEGGRDARGVDRRRLVAEQHAGHADDEGRRQARERAIGEVLVAERDEGEHAKANGERDRDGGRDEAADNVMTQVRGPGWGHGMAGGQGKSAKKATSSIYDAGCVFTRCGAEPAVRRVSVVEDQRNVRNGSISAIADNTLHVRFTLVSRRNLAARK